MSGTPMRHPVSNFASDFFGVGVTCNNRTALIVVFKWLSFTGSLTLENPFFFLMYGKDGENQTRDLTVPNLASCLRRHCEEVD